MKNKLNLLLLSATTLFALVGVGFNTFVATENNGFGITAKINDYEGTRIAKSAKYAADIDFSTGTGEYLSNVKTQYAEGDIEGTSAIRFVAAVKGTINSYSNVTLPGTYGFHISYEKEVDGNTVVQDYMYDVDYIYHSMGETIGETTTYYTNDYSSHLNSENRKDIATWLGEENTNGYNLFIALELNNIPEENLDNIITIQPYLKLSDSVVTSTNVRYATVNNSKNAVSGYFLDNNGSLVSMISEESNYVANLNLVKGTTISLVDQYGTKIDDYSCVLDGLYQATYDKTDLKLVTTEKDVLIEAESGVYDRETAKTFANNVASGNAGACDFNNCGQGISLMHYSYFAGTYDVEIAYWTGSPNSKQAVYVNGEYQTTVTYTENNGWAPSGVMPATTTISLTFVQGWNSISLSKDGLGTDSPEWGGYVMLDYLKVLSSNQTFDPVDFDLSKPSFRVEAEHGLFSTGELPKTDANNESGGYYVGSFDANGDFIEFNFYAPLNGQYDLQIGYAKGGNTPYADVYLNETLIETVGFDNYNGEAWNNFNLNSHKTRITLSSEELNSVKVALNSSWFCFDYIVLTYVGE